MPNSLKCKVKHLCHNRTITERERDRILKALEQEPKTGHWITLKDEYGDIHEAVCSKCDNNGNHKWKYCPNCGARMEEGAE